MNSLEFINQEIKFLEDMINMDLALMEDEEDLEDIAKKQQHLSYLQQIKTELEAWEVVKKHLEHFPDDYYNGIPEEIITMTSKIDKKDYPTIKKALEVKEQKPRDLELEVYEELCVGCSDEKLCHEECEHCVQFYERLEEKEEENNENNAS